MKLTKGLVMGVLLGAPLMNAEEVVVDFEDVALWGSGVEAYLGAGGGIYNTGRDLSGGFESSGVYFENSYTDWGGGFYSWEGWSYSTTVDTETAGYTNQYSAYPGEAASGDVYAVTYVASYAPPRIQLPAGLKKPLSISVANTSYGAISMRDGDDFAKQFNRADQDTLILTITGVDAAGDPVGSVEVYLADFRDGTGDGLLLGDWKAVDLSAFGTGIEQLAFMLESTDIGDFGMNTPAYIAVDDLRLGETPSWGGYDLQEDGWVDTGDVLGWVYPLGDYAFLDRTGEWVYLPEGNMSGDSCVWVGVLK
ncbi:MAG: DUF4465 domain-containing protein [Puniceicoccaceae bacterium]